MSRIDIEILKDTPPWEWPKGAGETMRALLRDRGAAPSDRLAAAELAGDITVINDEGVDVLLSVVGSAAEPNELRALAAIALGPVLELADWGEFDDPYDDIPITEDSFHKIQDVLRTLYADASLPKEVRRRILEASVRSPEDWHADAIRAAYNSGDEEWKLTAVFGMAHVRGFEDEILEMLDSPNPDIHYEAVCAAGNWEVDAAWPHVAALARSPKTDKPLLLAAIEALGSIRPEEAGGILIDLVDSDDEDIAEAANEAMAMAEGALSDGEDDEDDEEDEDLDDEDDEDDEEDEDDEDDAAPR